MENIFLVLFSIPFLFINYKILFSDINDKIIPNKYLGLLLLIIPFYYIFIFITKDINIINFLISIPISIFVSFILYYFGVWSAGDAKYLLILSLFIPYIGIFPFIGNLGILTICYLFLYFLYFYLGKCIFKKNFARHLIINLYGEIKDKFLVFTESSEGGVNRLLAYYKVLKWIILFLIVFVGIRLTRLYIIEHFIKNLGSGSNSSGGLWGFIYKLSIEHSFEFVLFIVFFIFGTIFLIHRGIMLIRLYIIKKFESRKKGVINPILIDLVFVSILVIILLSYIIFEFIKEPEIITKNLKLIFTFYIFLYLLFRILKYSYKITFQLGEQDFVKIENLKSGDIVDKPYLIGLFGTQTVLGAPGTNQNKKGILYPNPKKYFEELENPIDTKNVLKLKSIVKVVNEYHKIEKEDGFHKIDSIKILKTFAFGPYIFIGFLVTFFIGSDIFNIINTYLLEYFKISAK